MSNIKQFVFDSILDDIVNGVYPLDFVFNEKYLIEKYQVSRSPIRDALVALCNERVLRSVPRYGYEIVRITEKDMREIAQFRQFIELEAFKMTCERYCEDMLERITQFNIDTHHMLERQEVNLRTMWKSNIDFHTMLISFFENDYVENALQRALSMQYRAYSQLYWKKNKLSKRANPDDFENFINGYHKHLEKSLRERDFGRALEILRDDINDIPIYFRDE